MNLNDYDLQGTTNGIVLELVDESNKLDIDPQKAEKMDKKDLFIAKILSMGNNVSDEYQIGDLVVGENWGIYPVGENRYVGNYNNILCKAKKKE